MSTATTLGAYAAGLVVVFAAAVGIGTAVGPVGTAGADQSQHSTGPSSPQHGPGQAPHTP